MNLKTTIALVLLALCGVLAWYGQPSSDEALRRASARKTETLKGINPDDVTKLAIQRDNHTITLERVGSEWRLAGGWAARPAEVRRLLDALADLRSRFIPEAVGNYTHRVTVVVTTSGGTQTLHFGEKNEGSSFDRPTLLRVGDADTITRLAPGIVTLFDRPADYFQQRRLFPSKRFPVSDSGTARAERLDGRELVVLENGEKRFAIRKVGDSWELSYPQRDALDPRGRDQLLEAVADLWAERFVEAPRTKFDIEKSLTLTRNDGSTMTLEIGPPLLLRNEGVDTSRSPSALARLSGSDRVFEVSTTKFGDIFPGRLDVLRDAQLARFTVSDAREVKLVTSAGVVELRNLTPRKTAPTSPADGPPPPSDWRLASDTEVKAETALVDRLLSSLSALAAVERDAGRKVEIAAALGTVGVVGLAQPFFAAADLTKRLLGVDPPAARVEIVVEEGSLAAPKRRTLTVTLGRHDKNAKKLFASSGDYPRVNEIGDDLADQVLGKRALDFRGKKVLELAVGTIQKIRMEVRTNLDDANTSSLTLERTSDGWNLTEPVKTVADAARAEELAGKLAGLETLAYVAELAKDADAQTLARYGLDRPTIKVTFADKVLVIGKKGTGDATSPTKGSDVSGWYARLDKTEQVFSLANEVVDLLRRDSLAYRPTQLWALVPGDEVSEFAFVREGQPPFKIVRKGDIWEVVGPFTVAAPREVAEGLIKTLSAPRAESYRAHDAKDLAPFGLAKPAVVVTLKTKSGKEQTLRLGKDAAPGRFAVQGNESAVFVVGDEVARTADRSALDFLDKGLLIFDSTSATGLTRTIGAETFEIVRKDDAWTMTKPSVQVADERKVPELFKLLGGLRAERLVAYAPADFKPFGLDKPVAVIVVEPGKQEIRLGAELPGTGERYVQIKNNPAIGVLSAVTADRLLASPLTFRDHLLARVPDADTMTLEVGERKATFGKPEGTWKLTKPLAADAEHDAMEAFLNALARLRADEFVAEKPTPADVKKYGLDKPSARWLLTLDGKTVLDLTVGDTQAATTRRYARLAGSELVFLLEAKLASQAVAEYRPRLVFKDIDPAQIEEVRFGYREGAFTLRKAGANWEVAAKPDAKIDSAKVSDALSVLRELKLQRYVKDDGAQLKLFGLDPAELVLEVTTPTGKKTLLLGGLEGGSTRRYARLPGTKLADVFVLDEATSTKLFRKLADFGERGVSTP